MQTDWIDRAAVISKGGGYIWLEKSQEQVCRERKQKTPTPTQFNLSRGIRIAICEGSGLCRSSGWTAVRNRERLEVEGHG